MEDFEEFFGEIPEVQEFDTLQIIKEFCALSDFYEFHSWRWRLPFVECLVDQDPIEYINECITDMVEMQADCINDLTEAEVYEFISEANNKWKQFITEAAGIRDRVQNHQSTF